MRPGKPWSRCDEIIVLHLYRTDASPTQVEETALLLGREANNAATVVLKILNFKRLDRGRAIGKGDHYSKLDMEIWNEYRGHDDKLREDAERCMKDLVT